MWWGQWLVISGVLAAIRQKLLRPKKVGPLPPVPLLEAIDINGKDIASDALLTQTSIGDYIVRNHGHYHFTVKKNQPGVLEDIVSFFGNRKGPHYEEYGTCEHGRIEVRKIWTTSELNY
jgi:predicted transposase YbfD/YdcC